MFEFFIFLVSHFVISMATLYYAGKEIKKRNIEMRWTMFFSSVAIWWVIFLSTLNYVIYKESEILCGDLNFSLFYIIFCIIYGGCIYRVAGYVHKGEKKDSKLIILAYYISLYPLYFIVFPVIFIYYTLNTTLH